MNHFLDFRKKFLKFLDLYFFDLIFIFMVLASFFILFYSKWPLYVDQGVHLYVAWCTLNGFKPYVDVITIHLPGLIIINMIGRLLGGAEPFGIRLVDIAMLFLLCISTSVILKNWGVKFSFRMLAISAYLVSYFSGNFWYTAQKEGFALSFVVASLIPLLASFGLKKDRSLACFIFFGMILGFGLWTRITLLPMALFVLFLSLFLNRKNLKLIFIPYFIGILIISIFFIAWLFYMGSFEGFLKWSVMYGTGPYLEGKWSFSKMLFHTIHSFWDGYRKIPVLMTAFGLILNAISGTKLNLMLEKKNEFICLIGIVVVNYLIVLFQGKTHCEYHFIPLKWSLIVLGALLLSVSFSLLKNYAKTMLPIFLSVLILVFAAKEFSSYVPEPHKCTLLAKELKKHLTEKDKIVEFGFCSQLHSELERVTPFPFVGSISYYNIPSPQSPIRKTILDSLLNALTDPSVKYFIFDSRETMPFHGEAITPKKIVYEKIDIEKISELGFKKSNINFLDFEIYEKGFNSF